MAKTTIGEIIDMEMKVIEWEEKTKPALIEQLKALTDEQRGELFDNFCRSCCCHITSTDWSDSNHCCSCSPDPRED